MSIQTSTPIRRRDRLVRGFNHSPIRKSTPLKTPIPIQNDNLERTLHRLSSVTRRSVASIPVAESPLNDSIRNLKEEDLIYQLKLSTKLFIDNKITEKNAWDMKVIDVLRQLVITKSQSTDLLKLASPSLEVAAKVYGLRVDSLHSETNKWARGLMKLFAQKAAEDEAENDPHNVTGTTENRDRRQKKKKRMIDGAPKTTVNQDPKSYRAPLPKLESPIFSAGTDPVLSLMGNLFSNRIKTDHSGTKFMLLSKECAWFPEKDPIIESTENVKYRVKFPKRKHYATCNTFANFHFDNEQLSNDNSEYSLRLPTEEVMFDADGVPLHELDGSIHDVFETHRADDNVDAAEGEPEDNVADFHREVAYVTSVQEVAEHARHAARQQQSGNDATVESVVDKVCWGVMDLMWAGPSHWKFKHIRPRRTTYSGREDQEKRVSSRKSIRVAELPIDFCARLDHIPPPRNRPPPRKLLKLKAREELYMPLPEIDLEDFQKGTRRFMGFSEILIPSNGKRSTSEVNLNINGYRYDNPNDSGYCPQLRDEEQGKDTPLHDGDDNVLDDDGAPLSVSTEFVAPMAFVGENLVNAPETVKAISIPYATKPKRVNMKRLKTAVWNVLTGEHGDEVIYSGAPISGRFRLIFDTLQRSLPETVARDLSCHLVLLAVLQLCNEFNLELKQTDSTDFYVTKN